MSSRFQQAFLFLPKLNYAIHGGDIDRLRSAAGPQNLELQRASLLPEADVSRPTNGRGVSHSRCDFQRLACDANARADSVAIGLHAGQLHTEPVLWRTDVLPKLRGFAERRHYRVDPAVAIEVGEGRAAMGPDQRQARFVGNVLKYSTRVGEYRVLLAIHRRVRQLHAVIHMRIRAEQILPAVVVKIENAQPPTAVVDRNAANPRLVRRVGK